MTRDLKLFGNQWISWIIIVGDIKDLFILVIQNNTKCLRSGGPFFEGRDKILLLGEALKFGEIFENLD